MVPARCNCAFSIPSQAAFTASPTTYLQSFTQFSSPNVYIVPSHQAGSAPRPESREVSSSWTSFPNTQSLEPAYMEQGWTNENSAKSVIITKTSWWLMAGPNFHPVPCSLSLFPCFSCILLLSPASLSPAVYLSSPAFSCLLLSYPSFSCYLVSVLVANFLPVPFSLSLFSCFSSFSCLYLVSVVVYNFPLSPAACLSFPAALPWPLCHWRPAQSRLTDGPPTVSPTLQESCRVKQLRTSYPQKIQG